MTGPERSRKDGNLSKWEGGQIYVPEQRKMISQICLVPRLKSLCFRVEYCVQNCHDANSEAFPLTQLQNHRIKLGKVENNLI